MKERQLFYCTFSSIKPGGIYFLKITEIEGDLGFFKKT